MKNSHKKTDNGDEKKQTASKKRSRKMVASTLKRWKKMFSLSYVNPEVFSQSQCQIGNSVSYNYLIYRWFIVLLSLAVITSSVVSQSVRRIPGIEIKISLNCWKWLIYLTNWGQLFILAQSIAALIIVQRKFMWTRRTKIQDTEKGDVTTELFSEGFDSERPTRTPWLCKVYWVLYTIATDLAFVITFVYWVVIYSSNPELNPINFTNISVHALNSCIMLMELFTTSHEFRLGHFIFPFTVGVTYSTFSFIYFLLGGTGRNGEAYIYPAMDWNHFAKALVFVFGSGFAIIVAHIFAWMLYKLKTRLIMYASGRRRSLPNK